MMIERQASAVLVAIGVVMVLPAGLNLYRLPGYVPGTALLVGSLVGAFGIFLRATLAADYESPARYLRLVIWSSAAVVLGLVDIAGMLRHGNLGWRIGFAAAAFASVAGPIVVLRRLCQDSHP